MKKCMLVALALAMLVSVPNVNTYAEEIEDDGVLLTVEGENYSDKTFAADNGADGDEYSGGRLYALWTKPIEDEYRLDYEFVSPKSGVYTMECRCTDVSQMYTTDYSISVNNGEWITVTRDMITGGFISSQFGQNIIKEFAFGEFEIKEGTNTVSFLIDKNDARTEGFEGNLLFYIDFFRFVEPKAGLSGMEPTERFGIFERDEKVKYTISKKGTVGDGDFNYEVIDFWGRMVEKGTIYIPDGVRTKELNLGKYDLGWYHLKLYNMGDTKPFLYSYFSVVPNLSERYAGETPFATDSASYVLVQDEKTRKDIQRTFPFAGVKWVRERWRGSRFVDSGYTNWENVTTPYAEDLKAQGIGLIQILGTPELGWGDDAFTDLFRAYDFHKELIKNTEGLIDILEIDNELDHPIAKPIPADMYSAYFKAIYLAKADTNTDMKYSITSLCTFNDSVFYDGLIKNDMFEWSDIFNVHGHIEYSETSKILGITKQNYDTHYEAKMLGDSGDKPYWVTEAGLYMPLKSGLSDMDEEQRQQQARYLATSTVEALSRGTDKFFWFVWPKYNENGKDMSTFDTYYNPLPSFQAEAICTYVLGEGKFIGENCDERAQTYMFNNGENDVMVLWTDAPKSYAIKTDKKVTVTDMVGQTLELYPENGTVNVDIAYYPTYVTFEGNADLSNYYPREYKADDFQKKTFNDAERIILQLTINQDLGTAKNSGYELTDGKTENMSVTINNFNDEEKTVKLTGSLENSEIVFENDTVTVPAMSKATVRVSVTPNMEDKFVGVLDYEGYLTFKAIVDGEESSPTVASIRIPNNKEVELKCPLEGAEDINNYNYANVAAGAKTSAEVAEDGSFRFYVTANSTGCWYYPKLKVTDKTKPANSDGFTFTVKADENMADLGKADFKSFVNLSDGRRYYTGVTAKYAASKKWVQIKVRWDDLILFSSPLGAVDIREFDPSLIDEIEMGCHLYPAEENKALAMSFFIKNVGYFEIEDNGENKSVRIQNIEEEKKYNHGELDSATVILPDDAYDIRVMLTDDDTDKYTVDGNVLTVDLSELEKGKYTLRVLAKNKSGVTVSDAANFYIN